MTNCDYRDIRCAILSRKYFTIKHSYERKIISTIHPASKPRQRRRGIIFKTTIQISLLRDKRGGKNGRRGRKERTGGGGESIVNYRAMFARRAHHLRIPMPEELTQAVLIHAAANGSPSVGSHKLGGSGAFARLLSFS